MSNLAKLREDIESELIDASIQLSVILRKALVLAHKLKSSQLREWLSREMNGYKGTDGLPEYRKLGTHSYGSFFNGVWKTENQPIPTANLEYLHEFATNQNIFDSVARIESVIETQDTSIKIAWAPEAIALLNRQLAEGANCLQAYKAVDKSQYISILETTRAKLLELMLEVGDLLGESKVLDKQEQDLKAAAQQIDSFVNNIYGGNVHISLGAGSDMKAISIAAKGQLDSVEDSLAHLGIPEEDISELIKAITADGKPSKPKTFGAKVKDWLTKAGLKAADGTWKTALATAPVVIIKILSKYYGWE